MTDDQRERAMTLLENRRLAIDQSMWQAPTLTLVAQAFLLSVLTDKAVNWTVATSVAGAGVLPSATAMSALWLLHDRERHFSERVKEYATMLHRGDLNRSSARARFHPLEWRGWWFWEAVLFAFVV